jgi:serine/threonine protein kinase
MVILKASTKIAERSTTCQQPYAQQTVFTALGIMVHADIQPGQFLTTKDGRLKLNDFNRAQILLYSDEEQAYCRYKNGYGNGNFRAPEEYVNMPINEKVDVWSFGNIVYALLTGLWPFPNIKFRKESKHAFKVRS